MQAPAHLTSRRQQKIWKSQQKENASKHLKQGSYVNQTPFRYAERNFRSRNPPPDMSNVIDLHANVHAFTEVELSDDLRALNPVFGDLDAGWNARARKAYTLQCVPGLIVIPNPFTPAAQRRLAQKCLAEYPQAPHTSNLSRYYEMPSEGVWPLHVLEHHGKLGPNDPSFYIPSREDVDNDGNDDFDESDKTRIGAKLAPSELVHRIRWVTLGYQYHWASKSYYLDHSYPIPNDVDAAARAIVCAVEGIEGYGWKNTYKGSDFKPEAGVINYYQLKDTLMAHVDESELNMDAPLVSISLGHSCIYLIGGPTRDTPPVPLLLQSGDIIVMTGACRMAFHGVPRILEDSLPAYLSPDGAFVDAPDWQIFGSYLSTSRINLNIRQVFPCEH